MEWDNIRKKSQLQCKYISRNLLDAKLSWYFSGRPSWIFTLAVGHFLLVSSLYFLGWYLVLLCILFGIISDHTLENLRNFRDYLKAIWDILECNPRKYRKVPEKSRKNSKILQNVIRYKNGNYSWRNLEFTNGFSRHYPNKILWYSGHGAWIYRVYIEVLRYVRLQVRIP